MTNEEIILKIARHFGLGDYGVRLAQEYLDEYAHNLAEAIRSDIIEDLDLYGTREQQAEIDGRKGASDLIDPYLTD